MVGEEALNQHLKAWIVAMVVGLRGRNRVSVVGRSISVFIVVLLMRLVKGFVGFVRNVLGLHLCHLV